MRSKYLSNKIILLISFLFVFFDGSRTAVFGQNDPPGVKPFLPTLKHMEVISPLIRGMDWQYQEQPCLNSILFKISPAEKDAFYLEANQASCSLFKTIIPTDPGVYFDSCEKSISEAACLFPKKNQDSQSLSKKQFVRLYVNSNLQFLFRFISFDQVGKMEEGDFLTIEETHAFLESRSYPIRTLLKQFFQPITIAPQIPPQKQPSLPPAPSIPPAPKIVTKEPIAPAYPARLEGLELQALRATGNYVMKIDRTFAGKVQIQEDKEPEEFTYNWAVYNVTALVEQGLSRESLQQFLQSPPIADKKTVDSGAVLQRDLARRLGDVWDDTKQGSKELVGAQEGVRGSKLKEKAIAVMNLASVPSKLLYELGAFGVMSIWDSVKRDRAEREIPWVEEGYYLIRCVATPKTLGTTQRFESVAIQLVEVRKLEYLARNALDAVDAQLEEARLALLTSKEESTKKELTLQLEQLTKQAYGDLEQYFTSSLQSAEEILLKLTQNSCQAKKENPRSKTASCASQVKEAKNRRDSIEELSKLVRKQKQKLVDRKVSDFYRVEAVFTHEANSATYPLFLQAVRLKSDNPKNDRLEHWAILDATTPDSKIYESVGITSDQALWNALYEFSGDHSYGRGILAIRLPTSIPHLHKHSGFLKSSPTGGIIIKNRLTDAVTVLTLASFWVPGAGQLAMLLGGALAVENLYSRWHNQTLRLDGPAISDLIAVMGMVGSGVQSLGQFAWAKAEDKAATLFRKGADQGKVQAALRGVKNASSFYQQAARLNQFVAEGGLIWGNAEFFAQMVSLYHQEAEGNITHTQARRLRAQLVFSALQNNGLYIHGLIQPGPKEKSLRLKERPPAELQEAEFRKGNLELTGQQQKRKFAELTEQTRPKLNEAKEQKVLNEQKIPHEPTVQNEPKTQKHSIETKPDAVLGGTKGKIYNPDKSGKKLVDLAQVKTGIEQVKIRSVKGTTLVAKAPTSQGHATYEFQVPTQHGSRAKVQLIVEPVNSEFAPHETAHQEEAGHAAYEIKRKKPGEWNVTVKVYNRAKSEYLSHLLGHELNEVGLFVEKYDHASDAEIELALVTEREAGLFRRDGKGELSLHDQATAHELLEQFETSAELKVQRNQAKAKFEELKAQKAAPDLIQKADIEHQKLHKRESPYEAIRSKMLESMGLTRPQEGSSKKGGEKKYQAVEDENAPERIEKLIGLSEKLLRQIEPASTTKEYESWSEMKKEMTKELQKLRSEIWSKVMTKKVAEFSKGSSFQVEFTEQTAAHLLKPELNTTRFLKDGISGGHLDSELIAFVKKNPQIHLEAIEKPSVIHGITVRKYEQYLYKDGKTLPGPKDGYVPKHPDWHKASPIKTTMDNPEILFVEGGQALQLWLNKQSPSEFAEFRLKDRFDWREISPVGIQFEGFGKFDQATNRWILKTVYPIF